MQRPCQSQYDSPNAYVAAMLNYRRTSDGRYSMTKATRGLRRCSPALVSLVCKGKRNITIDRIDDFATVLGLTAGEKSSLVNWVEGKAPKIEVHPNVVKSVTSDSILSHWLLPYVKDAFRMESVQKSPEKALNLLSAIASSEQIEKAFNKLLRLGFVRRALDGRFVEDHGLTEIRNQNIPQKLMRRFHKKALGIAQTILDTHEPEERFANTLVIATNASNEQRLRDMVSQFGRELNVFCQSTAGEPADRLVQVVLNMSPLGGRCE